MRECWSFWKVFFSSNHKAKFYFQERHVFAEFLPLCNLSITDANAKRKLNWFPRSSYLMYILSAMITKGRIWFVSGYDALYVTMDMESIIISPTKFNSSDLFLYVHCKPNAKLAPFCPCTSKCKFHLGWSIVHFAGIRIESMYLAIRNTMGHRRTWWQRLVKAKKIFGEMH